MAEPQLKKITTQTILFSASGNDPSHDQMPLPETDRTVGETDTESLRGIFAKFGIADAWTAGRSVIVSRYADLIGKIYAEAGAVAVKQFLSERRRYGE